MGAWGVTPGGADTAGADEPEHEIVRGDAGAEDSGRGDEAEGIPAVVIWREHAGVGEFFDEGAESFAEGLVGGIALAFGFDAGGDGGIEGGAGRDEGAVGVAELGLGEVFGFDGLVGVVFEVVGDFFEEGEAGGDVVENLAGACGEDEREGPGDVGELALCEEEGSFDVGVGDVAGGEGGGFILASFCEGTFGVFGGTEFGIELGGGVLGDAGIVVLEAVAHVGGEGP